MKYLYALAFLLIPILTNAEDCPEDANVKNLRELASYLSQPSKPFTRCDFNGKMVDCDEYLKLKNELVDSSIDPNLRMP